MKVLSARRLVPACVLSAATVAVLVAPGAASATVGTQCSGSNITAQGSSLQAIAQQKVWNPEFNVSTDKAACNGKQGNKAKPTVTYTSTGSGAGLKAWGIESASPSEISYSANAYVGTDEPPSAAQITDFEANEKTATAGSLLSIPVVQESVAIIINLPSGCTATSSADPGRLVLNNSTLEGIFAGTVKNWSDVKDDGDTLTGSDCATAIQPVVRFDQSGTTHILKRYLGLVSDGTFAVEGGTTNSWNELSEGSLNQKWPTAAGVVRPAAKGGGEEIAKVLSTPGSVGYVNLAEARANAAFTTSGGPGTATFWAPIQHSEKVTGSGSKIKVKDTYADPSSNGEVSTVASANCKSTVYTNGKGTEFPPESVKDAWNEVTTELAEKKYTLCGLTYDLATTQYSLLAGTSLNEATTVANYLDFVTDKGGQKLIEGHDYLSLPKGDVLTEAQEGAAEIGF